MILFGRHYYGLLAVLHLYVFFFRGARRWNNRRATGLAYHYILWDASDSAPIPRSSADEQGEDGDNREIKPSVSVLLFCVSASARACERGTTVCGSLRRGALASCHGCWLSPAVCLLFCLVLCTGVPGALGSLPARQVYHY